MWNSTLVALITAGGAIGVAVVGNVKGWFKKSTDAPGTSGQVAAQTGDISGSMVAVGENITQNTGTIHQHYAAARVLTGPFDGKVAKSPSVIEIKEAIEAAGTSYGRVQISKNYVGLDVSWPVVFDSVHENPFGGWFATFNSPSVDHYPINVDVDLDQNPRLKVLKHGHPAWVEGRIRATIVVGLLIIQLAEGAEITLGDS